MAVIATASWSVPKALADRFPVEGSVLERYAAVFSGVEINSTFYRSHRRGTYERWAASVGPDFRFSVKVPRLVTHERRLVESGSLFAAFVDETAALGDKRGPVLCQLPPSLRFEEAVIATAFEAMRRLYSGTIVIEPRHRSWASVEAETLIRSFGMAPVLADPAPVWPIETFRRPVAYLRLHGSPRLYYSSYPQEALDRFAAFLGPESWCVFDNTAEGAATANALQVLDGLPAKLID